MPDPPHQSPGTGTRNQVLKLLPEILPTLWMIVRRDQRFGARQLYGDEKFVESGSSYFSAADRLQHDWNQGDFDNLHRSTSDFINSLKARFPNDHTRMRTALRQRYGRSLSVLYKNTAALNQLLDLGYSDADTGLELIQVPDQKSASIYTKIEADRVVLDIGRALHPFLRKEGITESRDYIRRELTNLGDALLASNVDPKYVSVFSHLTKLVDFEDDAGAISFGLHARLVSQLTKKIEPEVSEILAIQIGAALTHAGYFASQYKDWVDFIQNAQNYPPREAVESAIDSALEKVAAGLAHRSETVDERIPESIRLILTLLNGPKEDRVNAIYGGIRGVENICVATVKFAYDQAILLLQDAGKKARPTLVRLGAIAIIGVALMIISDFMPVIKSAPELNWIIENLSNIKRIDSILK